MGIARRLFLGFPPLLAAWVWPGEAAPLRQLDLPICRGGLGNLKATPAASEAEAEADFLEKLGLLEGHLMIGRRLLGAGQARLAVPHFGHPIRELYTWLEPRIAQRRAPQFERELEVMEDWAERGNTGTGGAFAAAWEALRPKLAATHAAVPATLRASPRFMLHHVAMIMFDVASDYGESVERGRIVNVVEYHDSMGYLMYAEATAKAERARGSATPAWQQVVGLIEELRDKAYPEVLPPSRPPLSITSVRSRYDQIRAIAEAVAT